MEQHPIPQQISSYQFRLVGDMTLKQFFQLAGGLLVSLIFYSAPIIGIIKWPFVIFSAILGVALAFLPLEERPLEKWIFAFFRAIYAPTEFSWKKTPAPVKFFQDEPVQQQTNNNPQDAALKEYLSGTAQKTGPLATLEGAESGFLTKLTGLFTGMANPSATPATTKIPVGTQPLQMQSQAPPKPTTEQQTQQKTVQIPQNTAVRITPQFTPRLIVEERKTEPTSVAPQITTQKVAPIIAGDEIISTKQAVFSIDAAPPNPPSQPNVVVGQVIDGERKILEGVIMEIRDADGRPVRAFRSNKLGHFVTITPLESGRYDIITEKEGYEFSPVTFTANGNIIPPILVQGRNVMTPQVTVTTPNSQTVNNTYVRVNTQQN